VESLSSQVERRLGGRRNKLLELSSQGNSQPEIAAILQVGLGTVNTRLLDNKQKQIKKIH
jgi:DNA-binding CsgD family transcriptional regulator